MLAGPVFYQYYQLPVYKSRASLLIKNGIHEGRIADSSAQEMHNQRIKPGFENEIGILNSYTLMKKVVNKLGLQVQYYTTKSPKSERYAGLPVRMFIEKAAPELYTNTLELRLIDQQKVMLNGKTYPLNQSLKTPYGQLRFLPDTSLQIRKESFRLKVMSPAKAITTYLAKLSVALPPNQAEIVEISLTDALPDRAEAILNQMTYEFSQDINLQKQKETDHYLAAIEDRLGLIAAGLTTDKKGQEAKIVPTDSLLLVGEAQSFLTAIRKNDTRLKEVTHKLNGLESLERALQSQVETKTVERTVFMFSEPQLVYWVTQLLKHEENVRRQKKSTTQLQPASQIKSNITTAIKALRKQLVSSHDQLVASNRRMEHVMHRVLRKGKNLVAIFNQKDMKMELYQYLLQKREETALAARSTAGDSRVIDIAWTDDKPVEPVHKMVYLLLGLVGLLLPIGVIRLKDAVKDRVMPYTDVEELTQVPILGAIAHSSYLEADGLVFKPHLQSVMGEQIRTLRTNLQLLKRGVNQNQLILITSSLSGEGKSLLSLNLGASLSMVNRPTIILEMDLRKPQLHKRLHLQNRVGISTYLNDKASIDEIIQPISEYENYFIITAGPLPHNPAELMSSKRLDQLFYELKERFAFVIVDSPPVGLVTDAQLIAPFADTTLYVVRQNFTPKTCLKLINRLNKGQQFQNLSIVLNGAGRGELIYNQDYGRDYTEDPVNT
ncbi:polysaccharide biosynthesis tyrosine autokinase [Larkinella ripae]